MKIKTKLVVGLSLLIILTLFLVGIGWYQLYSIQKNSDSLEKSYDTSILTFHIQRKIKDEAISIRNLVNFTEKDVIEKELAYLKKEQASVQRDISTLESMVSNVEQRVLVRDLKDKNDTFNKYLKEVTSLVEEGEHERAKTVILNNGYQLQEDFFNITNSITDSFEGNMNQSLSKMKTDFQRDMTISSILTLLVVIVGIGFLSKTVWDIVVRLNKVSTVMKNVANGQSDLTTRIDIQTHDEIDDVGASFNYLAESLELQMEKEQTLSKTNQEQAWVNSNIAKITTDLSGMHQVEEISKTFLSVIVPLLDACQAAFFIKDEVGMEPVFHLHASYAYKERKHMKTTFSLGEGLIGQTALEKKPILLTDVPKDYINVQSGLGQSSPLTIYVLPVIFKGDVISVLEIASFVKFSPVQQSLIEELVNNLGIILDSTMGRIRLAKLLEESQTLMEELQVQSEELQSQQEELRATNEELEAQTQALRSSEEKLQYQQEELEQTNIELREKAEILEKQNRKLEITNLEVEQARISLEEKAQELTLSSRYKSEFLANMSHELRTPLNSLLILSKLLSDNHEGNLSEKQVEFSKTIYSSSCDLLNIINDILDLAKIESGKMELNVGPLDISDLAAFVDKSFRQMAIEKGIEFHIVADEALPNPFYSDDQRIQQVLKNLLSNAFKFTNHGKVQLDIRRTQRKGHQDALSFYITDTGIGIPKDKQDLTFEAFQQADGTTSRQFGGTGLGLSICRQISELLHGELTVESEERKGSTFIFTVPNLRELPMEIDVHPPSHQEVAATTETRQMEPALPISLFHEKDAETVADKTKEIKRILIVDDDVHQRNSLMELIGEMNVIIKAVSTGAEALEELKFRQFDCMLLDLGLRDTTGFQLLDVMVSNALHEKVDIFIYTGRNLTSKEELHLRRYVHTIIIKDSHSPQRLMDELGLYLNSGSDTSSEEKGTTLSRIGGLEGKKVLLVDDDVRNVYALSNVLELNGMEVTFAENGVEAIKALTEAPIYDVVLMDIMMPEMDGYETIRRLRQHPEFHSLPIIALTAKAMKEDRLKCIEAGASDYIVKPVDTDQLMSLIRVWLYPKDTGR
ncbi:response regulator [Peribacillus acanthi]|uniref:response regulator n=1 Tax=Peribacillus acanthi TaxID=2171554 RepID=UPI000D3E7BA6|nr:response regulator [Peribacillus acanthi]